MLKPSCYVALAIVSMLCLTLAACNAQRSPSGTHAQRDGDTPELPVPAAKAGSITGMPDPRQGPPQPVDSDGGLQVAAPQPTHGIDTPINIANEPGSDAAVQVIRDYHAAINLGNHMGAYALWRDQGQASGLDAAQFAEGFANTSGMSVEIGPPGAVSSGAGQRHVEVPVSVIVRNRDGSEQRLRGHYLMQRSVMDGASNDQRAWRIAQAHLSATP